MGMIMSVCTHDLLASIHKILLWVGRKVVKGEMKGGKEECREED